MCSGGLAQEDSLLKEGILANINIILMYLRPQQEIPDGKAWPQKRRYLHHKMKIPLATRVTR